MDVVVVAEAGLAVGARLLGELIGVCTADANAACIAERIQAAGAEGSQGAFIVVLTVKSTAHNHYLRIVIVNVKPGQSATVVITAETRKDVLLLPLSVIAGRQGKGMVTVINDGKQIQTEVMLGATDGAYIEILSGVNEGDTISSIPPNLDPRSKE